MCKAFVLSIFLCGVSNYFAFSFEGEDICSPEEGYQFNKCVETLHSTSLDISKEKFEKLRKEVDPKECGVGGYLAMALKNDFLVYSALRALHQKQCGDSSEDYGEEDHNEDYNLRVLKSATRSQAYDGIGGVRSIKEFLENYIEKQRKVNVDDSKNPVNQEDPVVFPRHEDKTESVNKDTKLKNDLRIEQSFVWQEIP